MKRLSISLTATLIFAFIAWHAYITVNRKRLSKHPLELKMLLIA